MLDDSVHKPLCPGPLRVFGNCVSEVETSGVTVGGPVRGNDINTCSETLKKIRIGEKHKRHESGLILYSPET